MYNITVGDDGKVTKTKPNIFKKEIKLSWFFKFLLISGCISAIILFIGIIFLNISNNRSESLRLQKEINEFKYGSNKKPIPPTSSPQPQQPTVPQQVVVQDSDPIVSCKSVECGTIKVKRSVCNTSICCELKNGWLWANSETECRNAQNVENEADKRDQERENEEYKEKMQEEDRAWEISMCKTKAESKAISCGFGCLEIIGIDAELGRICQSSCEEEKQQAIELCDQL